MGKVEGLRSRRLPFCSRETNFKAFRVRRYPCQRNKVTAAHTGKGSMIDHSYDVYELLGVKSDASMPEIKQAYRWLQKRCHPDIAGPIGHDMAILLNDAYATLSDPNQRAAYDVKRVERAEFDGYTGKPLYSKWLGPAEEGRAIFVDESHCVGCLKCALIASNTFAIETRYGRARAVGQWGDSEGTVNDAIRACPVDCISFVPREKLPALEFVMTKQPRFAVGIDAHSNGGHRVENVFTATEKFLKKCAERERSKRPHFQETGAQKQARMAAAENIQTRAGRWWHHFVGANPYDSNSDSASLRASRGAIVPLSWVPTMDRNYPVSAPRWQPNFGLPEDIGPLLEAARRRRQGNDIEAEQEREVLVEEDYWSPIQPFYTSTPNDEEPLTDSRGHNPSSHGISETQMDDVLSGWLKAILSTAPVAVSVIGAVLAGMTHGLGAANSFEFANKAGPLPVEVTSGLFLQIFLAAAVWYMIGAVVCELITWLAVMRHERNKGA